MSDICECGNEAAVKQVRKEGRNQGRWFATCATRTCKFFKWEDGVGNRPDPPPSRPPQASPHLGLRRPTTLQQMRVKAEELAGGAEEFAMATTEYNRKRGRVGDDEVEADECGEMLSALTKTTAGLVACTERLKRHEIIMEKVVSLLSKCKCWGGRKSPSPAPNPNEPEEIDDDDPEEEEGEAQAPPPPPPPTKKFRPLTLSDKFT